MFTAHFNHLNMKDTFFIRENKCLREIYKMKTLYKRDKLPKLGFQSLSKIYLNS